MTLSEFIRSDESVKRPIFKAVIDSACDAQRAALKNTSDFIDRDGICHDGIDTQGG